MSRRRNRDLTAAARAGRVQVLHLPAELDIYSQTPEDNTTPPPSDANEARLQLLTWDDDVAHATLRICEKVWRRQGAKLYATQRDHSLREDLQSWLVVQAVAFGNNWTAEVDLPHDALVEAWAGSLYRALTEQARWHFQDAVGSRDTESGRAAIEAHMDGIRSLEAIDEAENDDGKRVAKANRYALHGNHLNEDPLTVLVRLETLQERLRDAEHHTRTHYASQSPECVELDCTAKPHALGRCKKHYDEHRRLWGSTTCAIPGCALTAFRRDICSRHYAKWKDGYLPVELHQYVGQIKTPPRKPPQPCSVEGCDRHAKTRQMCTTHYQRWRKHGTTDLPDTTKPPCHCGRPFYAKGLCSRHYNQQRKQNAEQQ